MEGEIRKMEMTIEEAKKYVKTYIKNNVSIMLHGAPGVGKSVGVCDVAKELAQEKGLEFSMDKVGDNIYSLLDIRASQLESPDIRGLPYPKDNSVTWLLPNFFEQIKEGTQGIIFFDEITQASEDVHKALFQLIHDKRIGDFKLPKTWSIVAAGNRAEDKSGVITMNMAMNNRFNHINIIHSVDDWTKWALNNDVNLEIISFVKFRPELLHKLESSKFPAYPTPRSWERVSRLIEGFDLTKNKDLESVYAYTSQTVGEGAATEFKSFLTLHKKFDLDDILNNPSKVREVTEISEKYALVSALAIKFKNNKERKKEQVLADKMCEVCFELDDEYATFLLKMLVEMDKRFATNLSKSEHKKSITEKYYKYFNFNGS